VRKSRPAMLCAQAEEGLRQETATESGRGRWKAAALTKCCQPGRFGRKIPAGCVPYTRNGPMVAASCAGGARRLEGNGARAANLQMVSLR
jgi:hypothetical protein